MNQCWNIVNSNHREKFLWNLNPNWYIFIQNNRFENVVCEIVSILSRPQYVYYTIIPPTLHCERSIAYIWSPGTSWNPQSSMSLVITYMVKSWMKLLIHSHTPRCNGWSLGIDKYFHPTFHNRCDYLSMLGLKLNHVCKVATDLRFPQTKPSFLKSRKYPYNKSREISKPRDR